MLTVKFLIVIIVTVVGSACGLTSLVSNSQQNQPGRDRSVLLPAEKAKDLTHQCSRKSPGFTATWDPTAVDIAKMEANFNKIVGLNSDLHDFYMQYVGLVVDGKKVIYINAFKDESSSQSNWKTIPTIVCDGGEAFWGILFDVQKGEFFDLTFNGRP